MTHERGGRGAQASIALSLIAAPLIFGVALARVTAAPSPEALAAGDAAHPRIAGALRLAMARASRERARASATSGGAGESVAASPRLMVSPTADGPVATLKAILRTGGADEVAALVAAGAEVRGHVGRVVSFTAPLASAASLAALPGVVSLDVARRMKLELDVSVPETGAVMVRDPNGPFGSTGAGVLVASIDTGHDVKHADFRSVTGATRFKSLFNLDSTCRGTPPPGHTNGCYFPDTQIDRFLRGQAPLSYVDPPGTSGHGTHTLGTAAGNGLGTGKGFPGGRYVGMAPGADLIGVKLFDRSGSQVGDVTEALQFLIEEQQRLGNPPLVVNMSFGHQFGAHDGSDPDEIAMDTLTDDGDANGIVRVFVKSAGNSEQDGIYVTGNAMLNTPTQHSFTIPVVSGGRQCGALSGRGNDEFFADFWYKGSDSVTVRVAAPNGQTFFQNSTGNDPNSAETDTPFGTIFVDCPGTPYSVNGDHECIFGVDDSGGVLPAGGKWTVSITGTSIPGGGRYDSWIADATKGICTWGWDSPSPGSTVSIPGTSKRGITVGAYLTKLSWTNIVGKPIGYQDPSFVQFDIAPFSSTGPTRDGRFKPDIAAPGMGIASTKSRTITTGAGSEGRLRTVEDGKHMILEGTSMSAPHVAGAVALLLGINPAMDNATIHDVLTDNASVDTFTGATPNGAWGFGKLNVAAAAGDVRVSGPSTARRTAAAASPRRP